MTHDRPRCGWGTDDALMLDYHDTEWGVPQHDDAALFEYLILDGAQAGLPGGPSCTVAKATAGRSTPSTSSASPPSETTTSRGFCRTRASSVTAPRSIRPSSRYFPDGIQCFHKHTILRQSRL